jgi:hypothetical protein
MSQQNSDLPKKRSIISSVLSTIIFIGGVTLFGIAIFQRQWVVDQIAVWTYKPTDTISSFVTRTGMNDQGKFYLYAAQPTIEDKTTFNEECKDNETSAAILGCYSGNRIYIYNVTAAELDGVREVTAAHEMLHVAYARLSAGDKARVDQLIEAEYAKLKSSSSLASRLAFYDKTEPGQRDNELHSIIGTEVASIDPALETYYQRYFSDRSKVVTLATNYQAVFEKLDAEATKLQAEINKELADYNTAKAAYESASAQLTNDYQAYRTKAQTGGYTSQAQANAVYNQLVARAAQLEKDRQALIATVTAYNDHITEINSIATHRNSLTNSLDSNVAPTPSV